MSTELSKAYDPSAVEPTAYQTWLDEDCFTANPAASGPPYCIVIPPPNVTGALHLGHAINNTLQDILTRAHRMRGFNTLWVPGIDHAGIATQAVVEKQLKEKENKTRHDVGREGLVERIWTWKQQYGDRILSQLKRLGASCDWTRTRFTLDEVCARAVRETFFKLFKDGLIYRGKRLVNWDIHLQTSISDDEIYHETVKTFLWHINYPIEGTDKVMTVATTRPETLLGDTAVAVHSEDPRWNWAIGKRVKLPLTDRFIPIIADDILVDPKFGSGVVKVTPAHDPNDYAVYQRHLGKPDQIDLINILNPDGTLNPAAGSHYAGLKRDKARAKVVDDLKGQGLLVKEEPYETQVGHSDRSKTPVEPYLSDQWFVKMAPLAEPALDVVRTGKIKFYPERHAQQYLSWLGEKRDWPISRQLWWGHRIPIWSKTIKLDPSRDKGYPHDENLGELAEESLAKELGDFHKQIDREQAFALIARDPEIANAAQVLICIREEQSPLTPVLEKAGFVQDPDVLDTWFSSALWPHSTLGWPDKTPDLAKWYPTSVLLTGRDIITLWVARMVMTGIYNMGDIPFADVAINPTILDGKGERMSKSKGNGIDPVEIIDLYGADALRFTLTQMATETQDVRMPVKKDAQGRNTSDKFEVGRNFANKLWNASRFVLANIESTPAEPVDESKWTLADRWILSRLMRTIKEADEALASYRFDQYAKVCYDFFWRDYCDWYVEIVKPRMKDPATAGQTANVLVACLDQALRLMHPMIPFITETIWWRLNDIRPTRGIPGKIPAPASKRLILAAWPEFNASLISDDAEHVFPRLQDVIGTIRNLRNEYKVDPKKAVTVSLAPPGPDAERATNDNRDIIELLAICTIKSVQTGLPQPPNSAHATINGCDIYVEGLVDPDAERQRLVKREDDLTKKVASMKGRLSNEGYIAKAPPKLVEQTKAELADAEAELAKVKSDLAKLG